MRVGLVLAEAFTGLRRNASMVISVVLVTFVSLTFVGAAILMQMQIGKMESFWADRAQVAISMLTPWSTKSWVTMAFWALSERLSRVITSTLYLPAMPPLAFISSIATAKPSITGVS